MTDNGLSSGEMEIARPGHQLHPREIKKNEKARGGEGSVGEGR